MTVCSEKRPDPLVCEGNLFVISVRLAQGRVAEAWSTGKMINNMNYLLGAVVSGEDSFFVQRPHCLCNAGHALAATRALERLVGINIPEPARLVRNTVHALQFLLDHLAHFYVFYGTDWCSLAAALRAAPGETAGFAHNWNPRLTAGEAFYRDAQTRLAALAAGAQGTVFATADGASARDAASPEASLLVLSHMDAAMAIRAKLTRAQKILQGTLAADATWHVGGLPPSASLTGGGNPDLSPAARAACAALVRECRRFIEDVFWPDAQLLGRVSRDWAAIGRSDAFLSWGEFPGPSGGDPLFPCGVFGLADGGWASPASPDAVTEDTQPAWSVADGDRYRLRFGPGERAYVWHNDDFHWFCVPRHAGRACEVGPLARVVGAYVRGNAMVRALVDAALARLGLPLAALAATPGRMLARGLEAVVCVRHAADWLLELEACLARGDAALRCSWDMPDAGEGIGLAELSRGALVHRIRLADRRIVAHEALVPSLWNFSPRDGDGVRGPLEQALLGTPVADPDHPAELLRIVHAFDPCNACVLRIEDDDSGRVVRTSAK
jgi:Ni,Fe-hydrogenase I large subunit